MTRSSISLTEGGGAKKTATEERTVGGIVVQSQYVIQDEPNLPTYNVLAASTSTATADSHLLQIMAPSNAYVRIHRISIEQSANATTATVMSVSIWRVSSAGTGGSAVTPRPFDTADTAGATAMTLPSAKGTESVELMRTALLMRQAIATAQSQVDDYWSWQQTPGKKPIIIPSGVANGIVVKTNTAVATGSVHVNIEFTETAWL